MYNLNFILVWRDLVIKKVAARSLRFATKTVFSTLLDRRLRTDLRICGSDCQIMR